MSLLKSNLNKEFGTKTAGSTACEGRCVCGNLLFRRVPGGIEIKCRRCKQVHVVKV